MTPVDLILLAVAAFVLMVEGQWWWGMSTRFARLDYTQRLLNESAAAVDTALAELGAAIERIAK